MPATGPAARKGSGAFFLCPGQENIHTKYDFYLRTQYDFGMMSLRPGIGPAARQKGGAYRMEIRFMFRWRGKLITLVIKL